VSIRRGGEEAGFGLIELVIALAILNVVILALFATFNAGGLALQRSGRISTAETLADKQMELYRASLFSGIGLENTLLAAASGDATHTGDAAWVSMGSQLASGSCTTALDECKPIQTNLTGPDNRNYRVDTYARQLTSGTGGVVGGRDVKRVTVVVRGLSDNKVLARLSSTFDQATGCLGIAGQAC
jgi:type II secretory pathway pseudopilin PulG